MQKLYLIKNAERRIEAGHLWIYSNEVDTQRHSLKNYQPGELVQLISFTHKNLGIAYMNPHCLLCARLLTRESSRAINADFFREKIIAALHKRELLFSQPYYRLVYGESDGLPGMVLDRFANVMVLQLNTAGMEALKELILTVIVDLLKPSCLYLRNDSSERKLEGLDSYCEIAHGNMPDYCVVNENDCTFYFPLSQSQKTGWFYDHRANRKRLTHYCANKRVLDCF
ncbi:MAG TPA: RlmI/RlmK family 23S rRNA methyltransferase, partial [Gammaproteobacteria bacterium]|nr:RlmI/RlmK family 23S rRNA methyltransferase [Gammaproteobacteria bacterium]